MAILNDVIAFIYYHYPHQKKLSKARLIKMLYLADWRSAITRRRQLTELVWKFNDNDILPEEDCDLPSRKRFNSMGKFDYFSITDDDKKILQHVIETSSSKKWREFLSLVYSTFPFYYSPQSSVLDLVSLAKLYEEIRTEQEGNAKTAYDYDT